MAAVAGTFEPLIDFNSPLILSVPGSVYSEYMAYTRVSETFYQ